MAASAGLTKASKGISIVFLVFGLAACGTSPVDGPTLSTYEKNVIRMHVGEVAALEPTGSLFTKALHDGYVERAKHERAEFHPSAASWFAEKARAAADGEVVAPEDPARWITQPHGIIDTLLGARTRLISILAQGGRAEMPEEAARLQLFYDCWVEEQSENDQPRDIAACREGFLDLADRMEKELGIGVAEDTEPMEAPAQAAASAPAPVEAPEPPARDYLVFFNFDKSDVRADSASILDRVVEAIKELGATSISLTGHADRAGADAYNQALSERRAEAVRAYLEGLNVSGGGIATVGRGETDPRVATPDGVREQENRRVEIHLD